MGFTRAAVGAKITAAMYNELADAPRFYTWPTFAQRAATTSMVKGDFGYQVDADIVYRYNGTQWQEWYVPWRSYTPGTTGISGGTIDATYSVIGDIVYVRIVHTFTGANLTAQPLYDLPRQHKFSTLEWLEGTVLLRDSSASAELLGVVRKSAVDRAAPYVIAASLAYAQFANITATAPFTWAVGDTIVMNFSYRQVGT